MERFNMSLGDELIASYKRDEQDKQRLEMYELLAQAQHVASEIASKLDKGKANYFLDSEIIQGKKESIHRSLDDLANDVLRRNHIK